MEKDEELTKSGDGPVERSIIGFEKQIEEILRGYETGNLKEIKPYPGPTHNEVEPIDSDDNLVNDEQTAVVEKWVRKTCWNIFLSCREEMSIDSKARDLLEGKIEETAINKTLLKASQIPINERIRSNFERKFHRDIQSITPWNTWLGYVEFSPEIKDAYIKRMLEIYPFLTVGEDIKNQVEKEKNSVFADTVQKLVCICRSNVYSICVNAQPGRGKWEIIDSSWNTQRCFQKKIDSSELFEKYKLADYDYSIHINNKYKSCGRRGPISEDYDIDELFYPVIMAMIFSIKDLLMDKTVVIADYSKTGRIVQNKARRADLLVAKHEGAEVAILYGSRKTYKNVDLDAYGMNYIFVKDVEDIIRVFMGEI